MLRFTPNDDAYSYFKDEFWFELAVLNHYGHVNDDIKREYNNISPIQINVCYAEITTLRDQVNRYLSPENRSQRISHLQATVPDSVLTDTGLDSYENLFDSLNLDTFSKDPLSLYLYLSHPDTHILAFKLSRLMNLSLGHCHAVISVNRIIDPILNGEPVYRHCVQNPNGLGSRYVSGIISEDFSTILDEINVAGYTHLLHFDKTRHKLEEIYNQFPSELSSTRGWEKALIQAAFAPQPQANYAYR